MGAETTQNLPGSTSEGARGSLLWVQGLFYPWGLIPAGQCLISRVPLTPWSSRPWGRCPSPGYKAGVASVPKKPNYRSIKQGTTKGRDKITWNQWNDTHSRKGRGLSKQNLTITRLNLLFSHFTFCFLLSCNFKKWINFLQHSAFFLCQPGFQITLLKLKMGLIKVIQVWEILPICMADWVWITKFILSVNWHGEEGGSNCPHASVHCSPKHPRVLFVKR